MPSGNLRAKNGFAGLNAFQLKSIAIAAMFVDHIAWAFVPMLSPLGIAMHFVGRITGPIMFFFISEGYQKTKNINRYTLRLGIFAIISYLPFFYFDSGTLPSAQKFAPVGVIYTLFLGLLALRAKKEIKNKALSIAAILLCIAASFIGDWGGVGVVLVLLFNIFFGNYKMQFVAVGTVFAVMSLPELIGGIFLASAQGVGVGLIQLGMFMPLFLLGLYNGQQGRAGKFSKWVFYVFYPAHLLLLALLKQFVLK